MKLTKEQIDPNKPPRIIGSLKGRHIYEIMTKGGFSMIIDKATGKVLGAGPHRGFARHLAKQNEPDFIIDELSKNEDLSFNISYYSHLVETWQDVVSQLNKNQ